MNPEVIVSALIEHEDEDFNLDLKEISNPSSTEEILRNAVTGKNVVGCIAKEIEDNPKNYMLQVIFSGGGHSAEFGPFTDAQINYYAHTWYSFRDTRFFYESKEYLILQIKDWLKTI